MSQPLGGRCWRPRGRLGGLVKSPRGKVVARVVEVWKQVKLSTKNSSIRPNCRGKIVYLMIVMMLVMMMLASCRMNHSIRHEVQRIAIRKVSLARTRLRCFQMMFERANFWRRCATCVVLSMAWTRMKAHKIRLNIRKYTRGAGTNGCMCSR